VAVTCEVFEKRSQEARDKNFNKVSQRINDLVKMRDETIKILGGMETAEEKNSWKNKVA
jgi:hypothetical protein